MKAPIYSLFDGYSSSITGQTRGVWMILNICLWGWPTTIFHEFLISSANHNFIGLPMQKAYFSMVLSGKAFGIILEMRKPPKGEKLPSHVCFDSMVVPRPPLYIFSHEMSNIFAQTRQLQLPSGTLINITGFWLICHYSNMSSKNWL